MYGDTCKIGVVSCSLLCLQQKFLIVVELEQIYLYIAYIYIHNRQTKVIAHPKYTYILCAIYRLNIGRGKMGIEIYKYCFSKNLRNIFEFLHSMSC